MNTDFSVCSTHSNQLTAGSPCESMQAECLASRCVTSVLLSCLGFYPWFGSCRGAEAPVSELISAIVISAVRKGVYILPCVSAAQHGTRT